MGAEKTKMSLQDDKDWLMLRYPGIFEKIMLMIGLDNIYSLDNCRQVCRSRNVMIMNKIWENPTKPWGPIIQRRIERSWERQDYHPSDKLISKAKLLGKHRMTISLIVQFWIVLETKGILSLNAIKSLAVRLKKKIEATNNLPLITCAASLAHHALFGSVQRMELGNVDLTSVPAEHLASLASSVTECVSITNVSGCGLVTILDSVKSQQLVFRHQSLDREETQALVRAMESGLERVDLHYRVTLDIRELMEYNGQGKCRGVGCYNDAVEKYREKQRTWASRKHWEVISDDNYCFNIERM